MTDDIGTMMRSVADPHMRPMILMMAKALMAQTAAELNGSRGGRGGRRGGRRGGHAEALAPDLIFDGDDDDFEDYIEDLLSGSHGYTQSQVEMLLCQGVKPWDDDADAVLAALDGEYDDY